MCGLVATLGQEPAALDAAMEMLAHRGPDAEGRSGGDGVALGHRRLSIIDLSPEGRQPMTSHDGRLTIVFNGEIYNYRELRAELASYPFRTSTDTEVLLAAFERWGDACLDRLIGMFAFVVWDERERQAFAARDRFGVKPLYWARLGDGIALASEVKALHALGVPRRADEVAWATYLTSGLHDHDERTFWTGVRAVPPGHTLRWRADRTDIACWYDIAARLGPALDNRTRDQVEAEYVELLLDSVRLRFRADVPVGINLSGGLDSSTLLATVDAVQGADSDVKAFTFVCGDPAYDELPWVEAMLATTRHPLVCCPLAAADVPALAEAVFTTQDEPYGGIPTLAYARLFEVARDQGVTVLLDGQGMDEQWAGYDYYRRLREGAPPLVQGTTSSIVSADCLRSDFASTAELFDAPKPFPDPLRNAQYRDLRHTKLQRAMRFNDRVSMRSSRELREPFLDHRLVELALAQPPDRKIDAATGKVTLRRIVGGRLPATVVEAPKRPLQTPQREWLRGPLRAWVRDEVEDALAARPEWLRTDAVRRALDAFFAGHGDSSFHIWQWISVAQAARREAAA